MCAKAVINHSQERRHCQDTKSTHTSTRSCCKLNNHVGVLTRKTNQHLHIVKPIQSPNSIHTNKSKVRISQIHCLLQACTLISMIITTQSMSLHCFPPSLTINRTPSIISYLPSRFIRPISITTEIKYTLLYMYTSVKLCIELRVYLAIVSVQGSGMQTLQINLAFFYKSCCSHQNVPCYTIWFHCNIDVQHIDCLVLYFLSLLNRRNHAFAPPSIINNMRFYSQQGYTKHYIPSTCYLCLCALQWQILS